MIPKHWLQATVSLILVIATCGMPAQSPSTPSRVRLASVTGASAASGSAIAFDPVVVGGGNQQVKATFAMEGGYSRVIPSVSLHYGHDYSLGAISCADQTCSLTVSFAPTLPGARPDALFLTGNGQRIGTISLAGTGQAPYALLQPESSAPGSWTSGTSAVLDENGTLYLLNAAQGSLTSIDSTGVSATLTVSGLSNPRGLAINGAGVLYVLNGGDAASLVTFDTVQQLQGTFPLPMAANQIDSISIGNAGELYAVSSATHALYTIAPDGTAAKNPLQGGITGTISSSAVVGVGGQLALGGSGLRTVSAAGLQSQVALNSSAAVAVLGTDAAGTLYANSNSTLLQLASPSFSAVVGALPAALALGSDGSLQVGTGQAISRMDRTQASLYFGTGAGVQTALLYNAGNQALTVSDIGIAGTGFAVEATSGTTCVGGTTLAPGASCEIGVTRDATLAPGGANGSVTVTSNSLNQPTAQNKIILVPHASNASQISFSPTSLTFPSTTVKVPSAPLTVTVSNSGTAPLNFASVALIGGGSASYSLTQTCLSATVTSLAPGATCTISVIFDPLVTGTVTASVSVGDDLGGIAGSSQTVALSGPAVAAPAPVVTITSLGPSGTPSVSTSTVNSTLPFGVLATLASAATAPLQIVAGTSTPVSGTITIANTGNAVLNISSLQLVLTGTSTVLPFTQTNNCGTTVAAGASCVVTVTFAPPEGGGGATPYTAGIVITDNALGTPHTANISAYATADDFTLTESTTSITVPSSGGSGSVILTSTPDPGPYPYSVSYTLFGMPPGATYSFLPASVNPSTAAAPTALNIVLPTYQNVVLSNLTGPQKLGIVSGPAAACLMIGLALGTRRKRMPRLTRFLQIALLSLLGLSAASMTACGGVPLSSGVAPGTYPLTITAYSQNNFPSSNSYNTIVPNFYPYGVPVKQVSVTMIVK